MVKDRGRYAIYCSIRDSFVGHGGPYCYSLKGVVTVLDSYDSVMINFLYIVPSKYDANDGSWKYAVPDFTGEVRTAKNFLVDSGKDLGDD